VTEKEIECGELTTFAIVVFDVNGLKAVNDLLGHQAGDRFIKEACSIICEIFKHSPVFRVGGDEFVAFAKGVDYVNIDNLMEQIDNSNRENAASGGIVIAAGMARYNGHESIRDVFERADATMYKEKKRLKGK
jgi:diguanylate cyclase (GGDEF)-like protein